MSTTTDAMTRRDFLRAALGLLALLKDPLSAAESPGNFRRVYRDPVQRDRFFLFLQNVFRVYPEDKFHHLIVETVERFETDREIYLELQKRLPGIKPLFGDLSYSLPALKKQREEMTRQTLEFLGDRRELDGYLEIGSTGRYVSLLRKKVRINGRIWLTNDIAPSYTPVDAADRGSLLKIGRYFDMGEYDPFAGTKVPEESLDVVANYIGFHHAPKDRLEGYVGSIRRVLRKGGKLVLRDHDVTDKASDTFVALAHDVFNAGVRLTWDENARQVRNFRSIDGWSDYLVKRGFKRSEKRLAQLHDPTNNLLVEFTKA